jgi:hypothetical protein
MAVLPSGAPYMVGTDLNNTIDEYTLANANHFDARVPLAFKAGNDTVSVPNLTGTNKVVNFPAAFPAGSQTLVFLTLNNSVSGQVTLAVTVSSASSFTYRVYHAIGSTTNINVSWIAFRLA